MRRVSRTGSPCRQNTSPRPASLTSAEATSDRAESGRLLGRFASIIVRKSISCPTCDTNSWDSAATMVRLPLRIPTKATGVGSGASAQCLALGEGVVHSDSTVAITWHSLVRVMKVHHPAWWYKVVCPQARSSADAYGLSFEAFEEFHELS